MRSTGMHYGADIMYRRPDCPGASNLPTQSPCYEMPNGTPAIAYMDGTVVESYDSPTGKGGYARIKHPDGWHSQYMHLTKRPSIGERVKGGEPIGIIGHGQEYPLNHKHFQLRNPAGQLVDPAPYLATAIVVPHPTPVWLYVGVAASVVGLFWLWRTGRVQRLLPA